MDVRATLEKAAPEPKPLLDIAAKMIAGIARAKNVRSKVIMLAELDG